MGNRSDKLREYSTLYESYVSTHMEHVRDVSIKGIQKLGITYRRHFGSLLTSNKKARILDVGCGYGAFVQYLRNEGYCHAEGIDLSTQQVELAHSLGIDDIFCEPMNHFLEKKSSTYDLITAIDVVDHLPKTEVLPSLQMIYNSLKCGGHIIIQVVNGGSPFSGRMRYGDFTHEFALTATSAAQVLRAAGFHNVKVYSTEPYIHGVRSLLRLVAWKVASAFMWACLVAETGQIRGHILTQNLIAIAERPRGIYGDNNS